MSITDFVVPDDVFEGRAPDAYLTGQCLFVLPITYAEMPTVAISTGYRVSSLVQGVEPRDFAASLSWGDVAMLNRYGILRLFPLLARTQRAFNADMSLLDIITGSVLVPPEESPYGR